MIDSDRVLLSSADTDEILEYRSVSKTAIVTLVLGGASCLALAHPLMWCLPGVTLLVGAFALRATTHRQDGQVQGTMGGRTAAVVGMCLAIVFGVAAFSRWSTERYLITKQSCQIAELWIQNIQSGDLPLALEWTHSYLYRRPDGVSLAQYYAEDDDAKKTFRNFSERAEIKKLIEFGPAAELQFVRREEYFQPNYSKQCTLRYRITAKDKPSFELLVVVSRVNNPEEMQQPHWQVREFAFPEVDRKL